MWKKKMAAWGAAGMLLMALAVMPVSAAPADSICDLCKVADCTQTGYHIHNKKIYCGYDHECGYCDGSCTAIEICDVEGCTETGRHIHDDKTYCGYNHECGYCDGSCTAIETCSVAGCNRSGVHTHNNGHHGRHHDGHHGRHH